MILKYKYQKHAHLHSMSKTFEMALIAILLPPRASARAKTEHALKKIMDGKMIELFFSA